MRLIKRLEINGEQTNLISDSLIRNLFAPGVAVLVVESDNPPEPGQLVRYSLGWELETVWVWFLGYVHSVIRTNQKIHRVEARELTAPLASRLPLALRHCNINDVLNQLASKTGLKFTLGNGNWKINLIPFFYHTGTGYHAISLLGDLFQIPCYVWQQQSDGNVYVGESSGLPNAEALVPVPVRNLTEFTTGNRATVPTVPRFRPGLKIQIGDAEPAIITRIEQREMVMRISWSVDPWDRSRRYC